MVVENDIIQVPHVPLDRLADNIGTIFLAENGRLSSMYDNLLGIGFQPLKLDKTAVKGPVLEPVIFVVNSEGWKSLGDEICQFIQASHYSPPVIQIDDGEYLPEEPPNLCTLLPDNFSEKQLFIAIRQAFQTAVLRCDIERISGMLDSGHSDLEKLIEIGISLSSE
ncbi:MAG TPA: hypothetical protein VM123_04885, partial [archaeon]|nr:hypothetical protein [archaeon]